MKQNPCLVVGEVAGPARIGFDKLDGTVEALCTGVADSVLTVVEQPFLMTAQHLDDLLHRLQRLRIALFDQALKKRLAAPL